MSGGTVVNAVAVRGKAPVHELALFAGAGLGILGGKLLGWRTVCAVEYDEHARAVLAARQNDGCLAPFPIWDDVRTFDGRPWRGRVDVVSGGFPCQDISTAGTGRGLDGERSGLWREMARIIGEVRPRFALVENSPALVGRGLGVVLGDLASMGYDASWGVLGAADAGAPHQRDRIWIVATDASDPERRTLREACGVGRKHSVSQRKKGSGGPSIRADSETSDAREAGRIACGLPGGTPEEIATAHLRFGSASDADGSRESQPERTVTTIRGRTCDGAQEVADAGSLGHGLPKEALRPSRDAVEFGGLEDADPHGAGCEELRRTVADGTEHPAAERLGWWAAEPGVVRMVHGVPFGVDRIERLGNGQVSDVVRLAWHVVGGFPQ